jgi:hypothetical protein
VHTPGPGNAENGDGAHHISSYDGGSSCTGPAGLNTLTGLFFFLGVVVDSAMNGSIAIWAGIAMVGRKTAGITEEDDVFEKLPAGLKMRGPDRILASA